MQAVVTEDTAGNGYESDLKLVSKLEIGRAYDVDEFKLGSFTSSVKLIGFTDWFNSVNFEFIKDGKEFDPHMRCSV